MKPTDWPYFFVKAAIGPAGRFCFVGALVRLAIGRNILTRKEVAVSFSGLSLW